jgi:ankyrin repeat protein
MPKSSRKKQGRNQLTLLSDLATACLNTDIELVKTLIKAGADVNGKDVGGNSALDCVPYESSVSHKVVQLLLEAKAKPTPGSAMPLLCAATAYNDIDLMKLLLTAGAKSDALDSSGASPMHIASWMTRTMKKSSRALRVLIDVKGNVNALDKLHRTPLMVAASRNNMEELKMLLEANAKLDVRRSADDATALCIAAKAGYTDIVLELLKARADVNAADKYDSSPLHFAAEGGHAEIVDALIGAGADLSTLNEDGMYPLTSAIVNNHSSIAVSLIEANATVDFVYDDLTPVQLVAFHGCKMVIPALAAAGVDLEAVTDKNKSTALMIATYEDSIKPFVELVRAGANVNAIADDEYPLKIAFDCTDQCMMAILFNAGATIDPQEFEYVIGTYDTELLEYYVASGADLNAQNSRGETLMDVLLDVMEFTTYSVNEPTLWGCVLKKSVAAEMLEVLQNAGALTAEELNKRK